MNRLRNNKPSFIQLLRLRQAIVMLEKTEGFDEKISALGLDDIDNKYQRIRCPACKWQPQASSRWTCFDADGTEHSQGGCWTEWNTFDTRGKCPGCGHQWIRTTCLRCAVHSLHEDWYEKE
jgi:hypothetical protein